MQAYQKGQKEPTSHSCIELNKTQFFPVSIVKNGYEEQQYQLKVIIWDKVLKNGPNKV